MKAQINTVAPLALALVLASTLISTTASANHRVGFIGAFGFAGDAELSNNFGGSGEADLDPTAGFGFLYEYTRFKYFHFGGQITFNFWATDAQNDANVDPNVWIDFQVYPKALYPFAGGDAEVYVRMPIGLSIGVPSDDIDRVFGGGLESTAGWAVSILAGTSYKFWRGLGAFLELGWTGHGATFSFAEANGELETENHQMAFNLGLFWDF